MSKAVDRSKAEKSLKKKGFRQETKGDHIYYYHEFEGLETSVKTKISHSKKYRDIGADNLSSMKSQLKLNSLEDTVRFLECPMTEKEYLDILREKGFVDMSDEFKK